MVNGESFVTIENGNNMKEQTSEIESSEVEDNDDNNISSKVIQSKNNDESS